MGSREVVTFQLGNYSNYIGAHWWNIQESYFVYDERYPSDIFHDVLFREGKTLKGQVTFTPRLILVDKSENMINVPVINKVDIKSSEASSYKNSNVSIQEQSIPEKHEYIKDLEKVERGQRVDMTQKDYNFSETVRNWSDFLRTKYHSRSVCTFHGDCRNEIFHNGREIYKELQDDIIEKTRSYLEECDNLQGFQILVDAADGFAGLAEPVLLHLRDEYPAKTIFTSAALPGFYENSSPLDNIKRTINIFLAYQKLIEHSSLFLPLGTNKSVWRNLGSPIEFPNIVYTSSKLYETSAILASFLDTVTLKYRFREDYNYMYDLVSGLNYFNKKVCAATMSLPFPIAPGAYLLDTLENLDDSLPLWSQLTPGCNVSSDTIFYQRITVRGIPVAKLKNPRATHKNSSAYSCSNVEELIHMYLSFRLTAISDVTSSKLPLKTLMPYPKIFSPHVSPAGAVDETSTRMNNYNVESCPVITGLHCCKSVGRMLDSLHQTVKAINIRRFHEFFGEYMEVDEFNDSLDKLLALGYGSASDVELR